MNMLAKIDAAESLPSLIDRAANALVNARSSAEVLEARDMASVAYDAAKKAARLSKAKGAHDALIAAAHRAQADALEIEAGAKRRLADEYDAAQDRGEVATRADQNLLPEQKKVSVAEIGLTHKDIHEARIIRDAEEADPGIVRRTLDEKLAAGEEPTKAALREVVTEAAMRGLRGGGTSAKKNPAYKPPSESEAAWTHVYGTARAFVEWATPQSVASAISGLRSRGDDQTANISAVRACAAILNDILEKIDAE